MKELSIEEKAKRYDEAIERAKYYYNEGKTLEYANDIASDIFPEIKENDDVRGTLYEYFKRRKDEGVDETWFGISYDKILAWLEKQGEKIKPIENFDTEFEKQVSYLIASAINREHGYTEAFVKWAANGLLEYAKHYLEKNNMGISEATKKKLEDMLNKALEKETPESWNEFLDEHKPVDKVEPKFKVGDIIRHKKQGFTCKIIAIDTEYRLSECNGSHLPFEFQDSYELIEQNPSWSEEDERMCNSSIRACQYMVEHFENSTKDYEDSIDWLKSIKDRVQLQWKPSEEQIQALEYQVHSTYEGSWQYRASKELLEQIRKL